METHTPTAFTIMAMLIYCSVSVIIQSKCTYLIKRILLLTASSSPAFPKSGESLESVVWLNVMSATK